jgi:Mn2+/Fe2+ NRAMP family transporter
VINGVVAVPVMVIMMLMVRNAKVMGKFPVKGPLGYVGWAATAAMALASLGMFLTALL